MVNKNNIVDSQKDEYIKTCVKDYLYVYKHTKEEILNSPQLFEDLVTSVCYNYEDYYGSASYFHIWPYVWNYLSS